MDDDWLIDLQIDRKTGRCIDRTLNFTEQAAQGYCDI